jgi:cytochrome P450
MSTQSATIPNHVPASVVFDFDCITAIIGESEPQLSVGRRVRESAGDIFYTPRNGGHWAVQSSTLATEMLRQPEVFSTDPKYNKSRQFSFKLLPVQSDGPDHVEYRKALGAFFAPGNMNKLEGSIRDIANALLDEIDSKGGCEFVGEFAEIFPVIVFLRLVDAPLSDRRGLLPYAAMFTRSWDVETKSKGLQGLAAYVDKLLEARRAQPGNDVLSMLLKSDFRGRPLSSEELQSLGAFILLAGLDTVRSVMSFVILYLAQHPDQYERLVNEPARIPRAVEEMLRVSGVSLMERGVTQDIHIGGVKIVKGDRVVFVLPLMGMDTRNNANPYQIDFDREISEHLNFGSGPHRCVGSHLARIEIRLLLQEWTRRFPTFQLDPRGQVTMSAGPVWAPSAVPIIWPRLSTV